MKKICILLLLPLLLCSCANKNAVEPKLSGISFVAEISYFNEKYTLECVMSEEKELVSKVILPETLEGFTLKVNTEGVSAEYLGITYTPTDGNMPFSSVMEEFYQRLSSVETAKEIKKRDNGYDVSFGEGASKTLLRVTEAGLPISIKMPDERFMAEFYNVTILK